MSKHNIFTFKFDEMYSLYLAKIEKKGRTETELVEVVCWLTGYTKKELLQKISNSVDMQTFFNEAPLPNPKRTLIKGSICGIKIAELEDGLMKEIRYLDKLVDELAKGKTMDKITRQ